MIDKTNNIQDFTSSQRKNLSTILQNFNMLTGIKICVFNNNGQEIAFAPYKHCSFCEYLHTSPKMTECSRSLLKAFSECRKTKKTYIYHCHMGLTECVSPIFQLNKLIGFIMIGQFKDESFSENNFINIADKLRYYNLNPEKAEGYLSSVSFFNAEKISASVAILEACASYIYLNGLLTEKSSFSSQISNYIRNNIEQQISVETIAKDLGVTLMELYYLCNSSFGTTPAKYIKKMRLAIACELLNDKNVLVSEIAYKVGINDYNYFSKIFKREFGISPTEYRRKKQN